VKSSSELYDLADANNHYTPVPNEIVECLCSTNLAAHEGRVIACLLRKTFGFHPKDQPNNLRKTCDRISLTQFEQFTGLDRRRICEALGRLTERHIITVLAGRTTQAKTYGINFNLSQWQLVYVARTDRRNYKRKKTILARQDSSSYVARTELVRPARTKLSYPDAHTKEDPKESFKEEQKENTALARGFFPGRPIRYSDRTEDEARKQKELSTYRNKMFKSGLYSQDEISAFIGKSLQELMAIDTARLLASQGKNNATDDG
jgi:phage replication O-like protein O